MDIIFVTNQKNENWEKNLDALEKSITTTDNIIFTGMDDTPNANRNFGLDYVRTREFIMVDDTISGYIPGWADRFAHFMWYDEKIVCMSARLLNPDGSYAYMRGDNFDYTSRHAKCLSSDYPSYSVLPMSCIIVKKNRIRFDEKSISSGKGYEDVLYFHDLNKLYSDGEFHINNQVRLINTP